MYNQTFHGVVDVMFDMFCIVILAAIFWLDCLIFPCQWDLLFLFTEEM